MTSASPPSDPERTATPRTELRVRHAVQPAVQDRITEIRSELNQLAREGYIEEPDVVVWGTHIDMRPENERTNHYETYVDFAAWAARNDYDLGPGFRLHRSSTMFDEDEYPVVTVPLVSLAVYEDNEVTAVFPHSADGSVNTIEDGLKYLQGEASQSAVPKSVPPQ